MEKIVDLIKMFIDRRVIHLPRKEYREVLERLQEELESRLEALDTDVETEEDKG